MSEPEDIAARAAALGMTVDRLRALHGYAQPIAFDPVTPANPDEAAKAKRREYMRNYMRARYHRLKAAAKTAKKKGGAK